MIDGFISLYGLENALIGELNPIMNVIYEKHSLLFILTKLSFTGMMLLFISYDKIPKTIIVRGLSIAASLMYTVVLGTHCVWLYMI